MPPHIWSHIGFVRSKSNEWSDAMDQIQTTTEATFYILELQWISVDVRVKKVCQYLGKIWNLFFVIRYSNCDLYWTILIQSLAIKVIYREVIVPWRQQQIYDRHVCGFNEWASIANIASKFEVNASRGERRRLIWLMGSGYRHRL